MVENDECGFYSDPENPNDLAAKLLKFKDDSETLNRWGDNARKLSLEVYDKNILAGKVADVLEKYGKAE